MGRCASRGGRPASRCMRDIVDAIGYLTHNGPVWRALPADFRPAGIVHAPGRYAAVASPGPSYRTCSSAGAASLEC